MIAPFGTAGFYGNYNSWERTKGYDFNAKVGVNHR
jgi:hypothetical protein